MVITADQRTLVVAESAGRCLVGFDLADDGTLTNQRCGQRFPRGDSLTASASTPTTRSGSPDSQRSASSA